MSNAFDSHTVIMLAALSGGFVAMARYRLSQALVMPLLALLFLAMEGTRSELMLRESFAGFAPIAVVFTAIAICAHQIKRSGAFEVMGSRWGSFVGYWGLRRPQQVVTVVSAVVMVLTWVCAGLLHNITAIMIMVPITITVCANYHLPSRWMLCGALVASNLGGFSTAWGDTPNLIEARIWNLSHGDFAFQIFPLNLFCLAALTAVVSALVERDARRQGGALSATQLAVRGVAFGQAARETEIDKRLLTVGSLGLFGFIVAQGISRELEMAAAAIAIVFAVGMERPNQRLASLQSLGLDVYMTLLSVFLIAHALSVSALGAMLEELIQSSGGETWAIAMSSYIGTMFTEAASWAAAAAPITHSANSSNAAAWALGGGICAGSSSLLTAASAGIILWTESRRFPGHAVEFRDYLPFGLCASLLMLCFYIAAITVITMLGGFA
jgi:Na+/H+ antiporter NhaD/arsenite permease-like protein